MLRWLAYILGLILPLVALSFGAVQLLYCCHVRPLIESAQATQFKFSQPYMEDVAFLARVEILAPHFAHVTTDRDAGARLNSILRWQPISRDIAYAHAGAKKAIVPAEMREELIRLRTDWMEKNFRAKRMSVDLSFMKSLPRYEYWDLEHESPIGDLTEKEVFVAPTELPIPEVADLLAAAKLRLMLGGLYKDAAPALNEVRALARLMITTENMQLVLAGLSVLDEERSAYRYFVDNNLLDSEAWMPVDRNVTRRARRAILGTREYLHLWTNLDLSKQIFVSRTTGAEPPGLCAALNEAVPVEYVLRPMLKPHWPMELDLSSNYSELSKIVSDSKRSSCRLRYVSRLTDAGRFTADLPAPLILNRLPYTRKLFALRLSALAFGGFEGY